MSEVSDETVNMVAQSNRTMRWVVDALRPYFLKYRNTMNGYEEEEIMHEAAKAAMFAHWRGVMDE